MKKLCICASILALLGACQHHDGNSPDPVDYVDMKIGTGGHGHVFMGASVPYGMVQLGPTSWPQDWDWCSGYHDSDSTVIGFSHTHLSGTGIGDLFDVTVMPVIGEVEYSRGTKDDMLTGLWSYADRSQEFAEPGYYSVPLTRNGIKAELTATSRVGMHRYTFPEADSAAIVIDLQNGGCWDRTTESSMVQETPTRITGYRHSKGWANDQKVFFVAEFSKPVALSLHGENDMYGRASFATEPNEQVLMKVAISPVSIEGAAKNMAQELPGWDFDMVRNQAKADWNQELSSIVAESKDEDVLKNFYTAYYHTMISPHTFCDVDSMYRGADGNVYKAEGFEPSTVLSLWDTYRAAMPLMSISQPDRFVDVINNMLDICDKQGVLPVWHLWGNETNCMVGNPGSIAVADAVTKKTPGVDLERAMNALLVTAQDTRRGGGMRQKYGYIPSDSMYESIAYDMEYAIADGAVAYAAKAMGKDDIAQEFTERSHSYRNYFDPTTQFMRGRLSDDSWRTPFNPYSNDHQGDDYCEGNAWQYTWLAPHDLDGLIECFGSKDAFVAKLDSFFIVESRLDGNAPPDISGLIGQYAHGNEPSHHVLYFYTMLGMPDKAADLIRQVMDEMYTTEPDGLCGNEDAGQMSAWYIMSAMGFYEAEPGSGRYWFGSPILDYVSIPVPGGEFTIRTINNSPENKYIESVTLNGKPLDRWYITHDEIMQGGELVFNMSNLR